MHNWLTKLAREKQVRKHCARKMEGLTPTVPATGDNANGDLWYNWRQSKKSRRIPHINSGWAMSVLEFLGVERNIIMDMPVEAKCRTVLYSFIIVLCAP